MLFGQVTDTRIPVKPSGFRLAADPMSNPLPASSDASHDHAQRLAWRALLAAAQWAREQGDGARSELAFGLDASGRLAATQDDGPQAWLHWRPASGWEMAASVPPGARALLDLYLPICAASAQRPLTVGHLGQSLDGYIATASGDSYYVTGPQNVRHLHRMRALCDAVIVGAETVARDDPKLTVRHAEGSNPVRVILDPRRRLGSDRRVFSDSAARTIVVCDQAAARTSVAAGFAEILAVPSRAGRLSLDELVRALHARGLYSVFVEGGGATVTGFLEAGLLDRVHVAIAPLFTGSGRPGIRLPARDKIADCLRPAYRLFAMGGDVLFDCDLRASAAEPPADGSQGDLSRVF